MNKVEAPSLLLSDFNYFINKATANYINTRYNLYDVNQQSTDDLRVLKATAIIPLTKSTAYGSDDIYGAIYECSLPDDYLHILNCICIFDISESKGCSEAGNVWSCGAHRLTADMWPLINRNFYMRPSYKRPYYYIHNVNTNTSLPTNPYQAGESLGSGTDMSSDGYSTNDSEVTNSNLSRTIKIGSGVQSVVEKTIGHRYGNASTVRLEIRAGKSTSYTPNSVHIDYIKTPQNLRLTQNQLDSTRDISQIMEFPDYVCYQIINELVKLVMENVSDQRLQTNIPVNQTIAAPTQLGQK